jgi:hypothetical protein
MKKLLTLFSILYFNIQVLDAQGWLLTGNANTNSSTNFLGTTDSRALSFRVNNKQSGHIDFSASLANTAFGFQALKAPAGNNNAAFGYKASFSNTQGRFNTSYGAYALYNTTTGNSNVAVGGGALYKNITGSNLVAVGDSALYNQTSAVYNTAIGSKALYSNTSGGYNVALGLHALYNNTTGTQNTASGTYALASNTEGSYNSATGYQALYLNQTGNNNTANGFQALYFNTASFNTANGYRALYTNSTGSFNTSSGTFSMYNNTTGSSNIAYGYSALNANTSGSYNTAAGTLALFVNAGGSYNTSTGYRSLYSNTSGSGNDAHGYTALYSNTAGSYNVAVGDEALYNNSYGNYNVAVGVDALYPNTGSYYNTAVGYLALAYAGTPGYNNVAIGAFSGPDINSEGVYNSVSVGEECVTTASNQARIGNASTTSIGGYANWSDISDGRVKQNIKQNIPGLVFINKLKPVTYNLSIDAINKLVTPPVKKDKDGKLLPQTPEESNAKKAKEQIVYTGFIAQDVEKAAKEINYDFSGVDAPKNDRDLYALRYAEFVVPLVKAVQELSQQNDDLKSEIQNLKSEMNALKASVLAGSQSAVSMEQVTINEKPGTIKLEQNIPNPFNNTTTINYTLPQQYNSAKMMITDKNGKILKEVNLTAAGEGSIQIGAPGLTASAYSYSLYVDGKLVASKQMILAK